MSDQQTQGLAALAPRMGDTRLPPAVGIGAIALEMAMKFHDINTIQDGALYQQYKLEGRNIVALDLAMVFDTAIKIEMHLLATSDRIAGIIVDALAESVEGDESETEN